jgi:hypothetical protein
MSDKFGWGASYIREKGGVLGRRSHDSFGEAVNWGRRASRNVVIASKEAALLPLVGTGDGVCMGWVR